MPRLIQNEGHEDRRRRHERMDELMGALGRLVTKQSSRIHSGRIRSSGESALSGFSISPPSGVSWSWPATEPIIGPDAKQDLREIKKHDRALAKRVGREITSLLDRPLAQLDTRLPDPPGVGPRYRVDLVDDYVAVYWVVLREDRADGAVWIERVVIRAVLEQAFVQIAPSED